MLLSVPCSLFSVFVTFPYGVPGQVWYFIVLIPYVCLLSYFTLEMRLFLDPFVYNQLFWVPCELLHEGRSFGYPQHIVLVIYFC